MYNTLFTGKNKLVFSIVDSTNTYAMDIISKTNPVEGTCIIADYQSAGRGQIGRFWHSSPAQNILSSFIFYPNFLKISDQFYLNIISGLAVADVVRSVSSETKIKWPNDIYIENKKVAGILVQNVLRGTQIKATVIGIGINVNESNFPTILPNPTSLSNTSGGILDKEELFSLLCARLEYYYIKMKSGKFKELLDQYIKQLYLMDIWSTFLDEEGRKFEGKIIGIELEGKLKIETKASGVISFGFREVQYVFNE